MSIRLGHKTKRFVRLGLKAGVAAGALGGAALGVKQSKTEFDKYKESEQQRQREENVAVFAGIAVAQTLNVVGVGLVELVLIGLTVGFSVDYAVSKAKKEIN